jgi:glycosyltransferase involved in cell wall biosynthesis
MPVKLYSAEWISREKTIYLHADRIFTRSSDISRSLTEQYGISEEKIKCIYAGANTPPEEIDPDRKDYSARTILFVGLDWERKGGPDLLEAFRQIQPKYPDALLVIAGSQVKTDLENVVSLGRISVEELNRYYREATIFCLPSRNEPFGVAFVEAMEHALPVVATNIGALPDMVVSGKNGYLIAPGDGHALAQALDRLLSDGRLRARFGRESWKISKDRYNWEAVGKKLRNFVAECIREE